LRIVASIAIVIGFHLCAALVHDEFKTGRGDSHSAGISLLTRSYKTISYTGGVQTFSVPANVSVIAIVLYGASGGDYDTYNTGGLGGMIEGYFPVTYGEVLQFKIGGEGTASAGGYNGGGAPITTGSSISRGGGGGSTVYVSPYGSTNVLLSAGWCSFSPPFLFWCVA